MNKSLPDNWVITTIEQLSVRIQYGYTAKTSDIDTGCKYLRITDIRNNKVNWDNVPFCKIEDDDIAKFKLEEGDLVFARTGSSVGSSYLIKKNDEIAVFASYLIRVVLNKFISKEYIYYFFQSKNYWEQIIAKKSGVAQPNVNAFKLSKIVVPLPPYNEQIRIVQKLDLLFSYFNEAERVIEKTPNLIKEFKQSILIHAISGRLTNRKGIESVKWKTVSLKEVAEVIMGQSPAGTTYNSKGIGTPLINGPVEFGSTPFSKTKKIKFTTAPTKKMCIKDDLLICVRGSTTGRINLAGFDACIGRGVAAIRALENVEQEYLNLFFRSQYQRILNSGTGATFPNISSSFLQNYNVPLPSLEEQKEIVKSVNEQLENSNDVERIFYKIKNQYETLPNAILSKAFSGNLVKQKKNDETAKQLIELIKIEKDKYDERIKTNKKSNRKKQVPKKQKMRILELLQKNKKMTSEEVWKQSLHYENKDIDGFYSSLRKLVEIEKKIKEVRENEKIYLTIENEN